MSSFKHNNSKSLTRAEVEELKEFRKVHKANCCIHFMHLGLLTILFLLFIGWQMQPGKVAKETKRHELVFDPET